MIGSFEFEHDGRTYTCTVEQSRVAQGQSWWWFTVSGNTHRYAPFRAAADDTRQSVRTRIIAYYTNHMALRSAPPVQRGHWARRQQANSPATQTTAAAAAAAAAAPAAKGAPPAPK